MSFAKSWGHTHLIVANLFAWRSTDPKALATVEDPVGPANDMALRTAAADDRVRHVVCAWGVHERIRALVHDRATHVRTILRAHDPWCFGLAGKERPGFGRQPKHPLYLPDDARLYPLEAT